MINFFNTNQGFIMSLLTAVYVIATIIIVIRSNKATKNSLEEFKKAEKRKYRPYVTFDISPNHDFMFFTQLRNERVTTATNIKIKVEPDIYIPY